MRKLLKPADDVKISTNKEKQQPDGQPNKKKKLGISNIFVNDTFIKYNTARNIWLSY